jgi:predicted nucleic acid-binding protein
VTISRAQRAVVPDASVAVRFVLGDPTWIAAWRDWTTSSALVLVPAHFGHEVANALVRGARIGSQATGAALERVLRTGFEVADRGLTGLVESVRLADQHGLTVYDAAYLDLAIDVDGELATLDGDLIAAAEAEGIEIVA